MPAFFLKAHVYLRALQHAVVIVELDASLTTAYQQKCKALADRKVRAPLDDHPHSLELQFPSILREISESARTGIGSGGVTNNRSNSFDPLWRTRQPPTASTASDSDDTSPLFYYVAALPYHVVYCTNKKYNKEDWTGRDAYWTKVADQLVSTSTATSASTSTAPHPPTTINSPNPAVPTARTIAAAFIRNMGADFVLPASHPQLGPSRIHPSSLSYLHRASFLRTDFDVAGSSPKDVVVPYFLPEDNASGAVAWPDCASNSVGKSSSSSSSNSARSARDQTLLFFAGSDNPQDGYRSLFLRQLRAATGDGDHRGPTIANSPTVLDRDGIYFSLSPLSRRRPFLSFWRSPATSAASDHGHRRPSNNNDTIRDSAWYDEKMQSSKFCLVLRGDTTSSKRFFSAVAAGCVPVVISDGLRLPFADVGIVDYSSFVLFFPESIASTTTGLRHMLGVLRTLPSPRYNNMRCALHEAGRYLLYKHRIPLPQREPGGVSISSSLTHGSLFNPVTLTLIELLLRREQYCRSAVASFDKGSMCRHLLSRLEKAMA